MLQKIFSLLLLAMVVFSCQKEKEQNPFGIEKNRIGLLNNKITVRQLDSIYSNDSIVTKRRDSNFLSGTNEIEVFEKKGKKLLILEASDSDNETATIKTVQLIDPRYQTEKGLSTKSLFKDIKQHYHISKINNTLSTAVIFLDSLQATISIDKKELPNKFRQGTDIPIKAEDIPDTAKIKHFLINW